jgi:AAA15 family ATPase/GTPase
MFNLILKNFRSFKDQKFHFSKVNILIGENSSGKSSLLKFLLALKQTVQAPASRDINLLFKGEFADLGSYKESVYYQDDTLPIQFTFEFDIRYFDFYLNLITARGKASLSGIHTKQVDKIKKAFPVNLNSLTSATYSVTKQLSKHENITSVFFNDKVGRVEIIHTDRVKEPKQELIFGKSCTINYTESI